MFSANRDTDAEWWQSAEAYEGGAWPQCISDFHGRAIKGLEDITLDLLPAAVAKDVGVVIDFDEITTNALQQASRMKRTVK